MQDLNKEEKDFFAGGEPLTKKQQKELARLKKKIPGYKPISWQGREEICNECPKKEKTVLGEMCSECGCLLIMKQMVPLTNCPLGKW